ncbi:MAG TPA: hypothetical protein VGA99_00405 [bacterium]
MKYDHKKRTLTTSRQETQLLREARDLLFQMMTSTGCQSQTISQAYQHLSILLEQYRFREMKRQEKEQRLTAPVFFIDSLDRFNSQKLKVKN